MLPEQAEPDLKRFFRILLLAEFGHGLLAAGVFLFEPSLLPSDLEKYKNDITLDPVLASVLGGLFCLYCVILIGLWTFKRWARVLYSLAALSPVATLLYGDPKVESAPFAALSEIGSMLAGAMLLSIWLVMRRQFARPVPAGNSQPPPGNPFTRD